MFRRVCQCPRVQYPSRNESRFLVADAAAIVQSLAWASRPGEDLRGVSVMPFPTNPPLRPPPPEGGTRHNSRNRDGAQTILPQSGNSGRNPSIHFPTRSASQGIWRKRLDKAQNRKSSHHPLRVVSPRQPVRALLNHPLSTHVYYVDEHIQSHLHQPQLKNQLKQMFQFGGTLRVRLFRRGVVGEYKQFRAIDVLSLRQCLNRFDQVFQFSPI
ncbi:hypothetical protein IV203_006522 [Nitzschia inconspicua]|uniref:Uncharacterized protein n=1 Tax=Nitzschia inconspicua TaxID=303405 RepID=A0A9K3P9F3_9STRA|nr:hypothetical protein IV203_006611 [Nitzschia inconspicua]KAG7340118.1 hypothetical protein IV203_006522 [Nitzschia inconspicua]